MFAQIKNKYKNRGKLNIQKAQTAFAIFALFLLPILMSPTPTGASLQDDLNSVNQQMEDAKNELSGIQAQKKTLQGQVNSFNSQIGSVESQIYAAEAEIARINKDITDTNAKIKQAEAELETAQDQLSEFIRVMYEEGQISTIEIMARSGSFNEFVNRSEYMEQVQVSVKKTADTVVALKKDLDTKKIQLEENKKKSEELKKQLASQKNGLVSQRAAKDELLSATKGNEAEYQALLAKLKKQYNSIQSQIWYGGNYVSLGSVKAGDIIGQIGNSGFSTGCHLHFEIRTASKSTVNPASKIGDGYFIHPTPGVRVSAPYGYSSYYFDWFHSGIDYADGCAGTPIRATADGEIIVRVTGRPNTYPWSYEYGNYVMIRHTNGMYSLYGHLR